MKRCPFCAEEIQDAAIVCKHCQRELRGGADAPEPALAVGPATGTIASQPRGRRARPLYLLLAAVGFVMTLWAPIGILVLWVGLALGLPGHAVIRWFGGLVGAVVLTGVATTLGERSTPQRTTPPPTATQLTGCQAHIELHSAAHWARELGQTEMWVLANHRVNVFSGFGNNRGHKVGEMYVGSRAVILGENADAYRVQSPLDGSTGWISKIQVARTLSQDVQTRKPCSAR